MADQTTAEWIQQRVRNHWGTEPGGWLIGELMAAAYAKGTSAAYNEGIEAAVKECKRQEKHWRKKSEKTRHDVQWRLDANIASHLADSIQALVKGGE